MGLFLSMKKKIAIINGPNLNLLGKREVNIYGNENWSNFFKKLEKEFPSISLSHYQSNIEGELINYLQKIGFEFDGIILNAGAYTHTSIALHDCIKSITTPVIEVHISNIYARENFRQKSFLSPVCKGTISGFGLNSYYLAIFNFTKMTNFV